jgi:hypothetical protein
MRHPTSSSSPAPNPERPVREPLPLEVRKQLWIRFWDILLSPVPDDPPTKDRKRPTTSTDQERR